MAESLFTTQTPASGDNSDGTPGITVATSVQFAVAGQITHVRFYATATISGNYQGVVWRVDTADPNTGGGTQLAATASTASTSITAGAWNTIALTSPLTITVGQLYRIGVFSDAGRYVLTSHFFDSGLTSGDISAGANASNPSGLGSMNQGVFIVNAAVSYPTAQFNASSYFADVVFVPAGTTSVSPTGIAVSTALGTPTVAQSLTTAPTGIAVSTALGTPTVAQALTAAPSGIAAPVALGTPTVAMLAGGATNPTGIAVPVALGNPTVSFTSTYRQGSWYQLMGILEQARVMHAEDQMYRWIACPNDGEPLSRSRTGVLYCRYDGWQPPNQAPGS